MINWGKRHKQKKNRATFQAICNQAGKDYQVVEPASLVNCKKCLAMMAKESA